MSDELRAFYQRQIDDPATPAEARVAFHGLLDALSPAPPAPDRPTNTASPAAATATVGDANAITDANAAIGATAGRDINQKIGSSGSAVGNICSQESF